MSGHSKWSTIKHKKAKEDAARGKVFTKLSREITVAAREGGGDPAGNATLRRILDDARAANMPHDNVIRAIKKGTGEIEGAHYEEHLYEGYGPAGVAVIIETLSDNKNRTVSDLRHAFTKAGGNLAEGGAVSWMFHRQGVIRMESRFSEDQLLELLLDYNIHDIVLDDGHVMIVVAVSDLEHARKTLESAQQKIDSAQLEWVAQNKVSVDDDQAETICKFLDQLDDLDDVQGVYHNLHN